MALEGYTSNFPDPDLIPSNIKDGVTIFGVEGDYSGWGWAIFWWSYFYNYSVITPTILIATFADLNRPANSWEAGDFLCEYNNRVYYFYSQNTWNYSNTKIIWYIPQDGNSVTQIHTYWTSVAYSDDYTINTKFDSAWWNIYYSVYDYDSWEGFYHIRKIDLNTETTTQVSSWYDENYPAARALIPWNEIWWTLTLDTSRWQTFEIKINVINWVAVTGQTHMSIWWINISTT